VEPRSTEGRQRQRLWSGPGADGSRYPRWLCERFLLRRRRRPRVVLGLRGFGGICKRCLMRD
jgi:hypothetical protein